MDLVVAVGTVLVARPSKHCIRSERCKDNLDEYDVRVLIVLNELLM